jgi:hypothetical protein
VDVDLANLGFRSGDEYELRNVQAYFEDIVTGTYRGEPIRISMTDRPAADPVAWKPPASSFPEFGVFVLINVSGKRRN